MNKKLLNNLSKIQKDLMKKKAEFAAKEFEVDYKNGAVIVNINGARKIIKITVNKTLIDPEDPITLQEMIVEAVNQAVEAIDAKENEEIPELSKAIDLVELL